MRLTYTIELDVERKHGPDVKKDRVSAAIINELIRYFDDGEYTVRASGGARENTDIEVKDATVWPHEDSIPQRASVARRAQVERLPYSIAEPGT